MINEFPVFDGHNDTILDLHVGKKKRSFFKKSKRGHIDLPRAQKGGLGGGFFALFVPSPKPMEEMPGEQLDGGGYKYPKPKPLSLEYALHTTISMMAVMLKVEKEAQGQAKIVKTVAELEECLANGTLAMILHFEGADTIDTDLHALHTFYAAGLRSLGLVWSRDNAFGTGVPFNFPDSPDIGPGLTEAGKRLVQACNELGIMVDLSHLNEKGFWDVAGLSSAPLVATHSNAHALAASPRNLTDEQLKAVAQSNGLVGINYHKGFLREDGRSDKKTSLKQIVRHVNYIADLVGVDHVALGSDFDGAKMPENLRDAAGLPKLLKALRKSGHDDESLKKITHQNWVRVLGETWK